MKYAILGSGKTGCKVVDILKDSSHTVFNNSNKISVEKLADHDVLISFVNGQVLLDNLDILLESGIPHVTGATGVDWPKDLNDRLITAKTKWMIASNFSLGMNLVKAMINCLGKANLLFKNFEFKIHEVHHSQKLDAPSGTALSWKDWLGSTSNIPISSERVGNITGIHEVRLNTENEEIFLRHEAKDRKIFAEGAVWAAQQMVEDNNIQPGLHKFEDYAATKILEQK